jgi:hypothetical protein
MSILNRRKTRIATREAEQQETQTWRDSLWATLDHEPAEVTVEEEPPTVAADAEPSVAFGPAPDEMVEEEPAVPEMVQEEPVPVALDEELSPVTFEPEAVLMTLEEAPWPLAFEETPATEELSSVDELAPVALMAPVDEPSPAPSVDEPAPVALMAPVDEPSPAEAPEPVVIRALARVPDISDVVKAGQSGLDAAMERGVGEDHAAQLLGGDLGVHSEGQETEHLATSGSHGGGSDQPTAVGVLDQFEYAFVAHLVDPPTGGAGNFG